MKQLDLFTGQESEYVERFPLYLSHFDSPRSLERLLSGLNVLEVGLFYLGDKMKKRPISPNYEGLCPFHGEKTPSFYLQPKKNRFHCYGCGQQGGPLLLDLNLGNKLYTTITEKARINDLSPFILRDPFFELYHPLSHYNQEQKGYLSVLKEAFQREK